MANKKGKLKANQIDIFGTRFCFPKSARKKLNKENPLLKRKKLDVRDLPKILDKI